MGALCNRGLTGLDGEPTTRADSYRQEHGRAEKRVKELEVDPPDPMKGSLIPTVATATLLAVVAPPAAAVVVHIVPDEPIEVKNLAGFRDQDLDIDGDGAVDFVLAHNAGSSLYVQQQGTNRVLMRNGDGIPDVSGLIVGADLEEDQFWQAIIMLTVSKISPDIQICVTNGAGSGCDGNFVGRTGIFGVEFDIAGQTHYGWVRATGAPSAVRMEFSDWAYESEPGVPILAGAVPEPSGAALLALGAAAVASRRRRPWHRRPADVRPGGVPPPGAQPLRVSP